MVRYDIERIIGELQYYQRELNDRGINPDTIDDIDLSRIMGDCRQSES